MKNSRNKIYLDYAATTPMDKEVKLAMEPYFYEKFGNPGSLHSFGQEALAAVDESREKIAKAIGADFREIIFTGSATEANNLALRGIIKGFKFKVLGFSNKNQKYSLTPNTKNLTPRIIISAIEHKSILETCRNLNEEGIEIIYLPVDKQGIVDLKKLKESLNERTILVSIMYANNEIGTIQNISAIAEIIKKFKIEKLKGSEKNNLLVSQYFNQQYPLFHTDAVQAFQFLNCNVNDLGVDLMTLSAHKIYGPKGIGLLYVCNLKPNTQNLKPIITGGGQEFGLRSGTENAPAIAGFAKAVELAEKNREKELKRIAELSVHFWKELKKIYPNIQLNNNYNQKFVFDYLPNILNIYFPNQNAQDLLMKLDLNGVAVSSGSACSARATKPSHILKAIGLSEKKIKSSLRFSFGKFTNKKEISDVIKIIKKI